MTQHCSWMLCWYIWRGSARYKVYYKWASREQFKIISFTYISINCIKKKVKQQFDLIKCKNWFFNDIRIKIGNFLILNFYLMVLCHSFILMSIKNITLFIYLCSAKILPSFLILPRTSFEHALSIDMNTVTT